MSMASTDMGILRDEECKCTNCGKTLYANTEAIVFHTRLTHPTNPPIVLGPCCAFSVLRSLVCDFAEVAGSANSEMWKFHTARAGHAAAFRKVADVIDNWIEIFDSFNRSRE